MIQNYIAKEPQNNSSIKNEIKIVSSEEEKIGINTKVILKTKYKDCSHEKEEIIDKIKVINLTKKELQELYKKCTITKFTKDEVVLEKYENGICGEHFFITEKNGNIIVYNIMINGAGEKTKKEYITTDIATTFLPEDDYIKIKNGIEIYGKEELNKFLEDYE